MGNVRSIISPHITSLLARYSYWGRISEYIYTWCGSHGNVNQNVLDFIKNAIGTQKDCRLSNACAALSPALSCFFSAVLMALRSLGRDCPRIFKARMGRQEGRRRTEFSTLRGSCLTFFPGGNLCSWGRDCKPTHATPYAGKVPICAVEGASIFFRSRVSAPHWMEGRSVPTEPLALRRLALPWVLAFVREGPPHRPGLRWRSIGAVSDLIFFFVGYPTHFRHPGIRLEFNSVSHNYTGITRRRTPPFFCCLCVVLL